MTQVNQRDFQRDFCARNGAKVQATRADREHAKRNMINALADETCEVIQIPGGRSFTVPVELLTYVRAEAKKDTKGSRATELRELLDEIRVQRAALDEAIAVAIRISEAADAEAQVEVEDVEVEPELEELQ